MFVSCTNSSVYTNHVTFENETWETNNIISFPVMIEDTAAYHNIIINVRNTTFYPNANLFLFINTTSPDNHVLRDTVELFLANEKGEWLGTGVGKLRDNSIYYQKNIRFPLKGIYRFDIQQAMRTDKLEGIYNIGIGIEKSKLK